MAFFDEDQISGLSLVERRQIASSANDLFKRVLKAAEEEYKIILSKEQRTKQELYYIRQDCDKAERKLKRVLAKEQYLHEDLKDADWMISLRFHEVEKSSLALVGERKSLKNAKAELDRLRQARKLKECKTKIGQLLARKLLNDAENKSRNETSGNIRAMFRNVFKRFAKVKTTDKKCEINESVNALLNEDKQSMNKITNLLQDIDNFKQKGQKKNRFFAFFKRSNSESKTSKMLQKSLTELNQIEVGVHSSF